MFFTHVMLLIAKVNVGSDHVSFDNERVSMLVVAITRMLVQVVIQW